MLRIETDHREMDQDMIAYTYMDWDQFQEEILCQTTDYLTYEEGDPFFLSQDRETEYSLEDIKKIFLVLQENENLLDISGAVYGFLELFSVAEIDKFDSLYVGQHGSLEAYLFNNSGVPAEVKKFVDWEAYAKWKGIGVNYEVSNGHLFRR